MTKLISFLFVLLSIYSSSAQSIININKASDKRYKEIIITKNIASNFSEAKHLRELVLNEKLQNIKSVRVNDTILLDLFNNKQYKACIDNIDIDVNGTITIIAKLANLDYSYCIISTFNGKSFMTIEVPENNEFYSTKYNHKNNKYYLQQIDKLKQKSLEGAPSLVIPEDKIKNINYNKSIKQELPDQKPLKNNESIAINSTIVNDQLSQDTVTLLIVYTASAAAWATSNESNINNTISLLMAKAKLSLDNSNTLLTIKLVHSEQVNYTELNTNDDLYNLTNIGDGILENVHTLRNTYCADVVVLLENISFTGGLGWLLNTYSGLPTYAFSLTRVQQASWTFTTVHEIGHNMGLHHHIEQNVQPGPGLDSYSAGWRWNGTGGVKYCSVMTYEGGTYFADGINATRTPYFSNPGIQYQGVPVGDAVNGDNARTLRQVKAVVAAYRTGCVSTCTTPTTQATAFNFSAITNNTMTTSWTRGNGTGGVIVLARVGSAVNAEPVNGNSYAADAAFGNGSQIGTGNFVIYDGTGTSVNISSLIAGSSYYFAVYEYNNSGYCYKTPALTGNYSTTGTSPYCAAGSNSTSYEYISNVLLGTINQTSGNVAGGYQDFTSLSTTLQIGTSYSATITVGNPYTSDQILIWIDWNHDGDFTDADENVYASIGSFSTPHITSGFTPPLGALLGNTRMRIRLHDTGAGPNATPCGNSSYGEVEDYSINVISNTCSPVNITNHPATMQTSCSPSANISFTVTATGDSPITYQWQYNNGGNWINISNGMPSGAFYTNGNSNSMTVNGITNASSYEYRCILSNCNGINSQTSNNALLVINPNPSVAGTITGLATVCQGQSNVTYTVPTIANTNSYIWTLPTGATGTSSTASISVSFGTSAVSENITVKGTNSCGEGGISTKAITVNPLPFAAGTIAGLATVCQGQTNITYTIPAITNVTSYTWTLPSEATGTSSTNSITVNYGTSAVSGNIKVKGSNSCGIRDSSVLAITVNPLPVAAGAITGSTTVCQGQSNVTYTIPSITNATAYTWTLPTGATGTNTNNSITVNYGISAVSGSIKVKGSNTCGIRDSSILVITVNPLPVEAGTITGSTTVCQGQNNVTYTIPAITNATTYTWTLPSGALGTSSTNSITVNYGTSAVSGSLKVKGSNSCGIRDSSVLAITVNPLPVAAGAITGLTTVCQGQSNVTYTIPAITNATAYTWTLPTGATGTNTNNSITVNYGISVVSGSIKVKGSNSCGIRDSAVLAITVNPLPVAAGTITGSTSVCQGQSNVTYTIPAITNATSYTWTLPTGATGSSTTNSITVNYGTSAVSGSIKVKGSNSCGIRDSAVLVITVNPLPVAAGTISGLATVCQGQNSVTYTVPTISNATCYIWFPSNPGISIYPPASCSNSITINFSSTTFSGSISVKGTNSCGDGSISTKAINVNSLPVAAGTITGSTTVCQGQSSVTYSVPTIANATSYVWTLPTGATGTSATNSIIVNYGTSAVLGNITVKGTNSCGNGTPSTLTINVNPLPVVGNQTTSISSGSMFNVIPAGVPAGTIYTWSAPVYTGGVTGGSAQAIGQTNISQTLTIPSGSGTATYTVTPTSGNCSGNTFTVTVSVNHLVSCPPPWIPVQNQQYNMNVISKLFLSNILTTNHLDAIGAFVGQQCRGIAYPDTSLNGTLFLSISSNVISGEIITFKAWNSQQCNECSIFENLTFANQSVVGNINNPVDFHCGVSELCNNFGAGYTWFSVNVNPGSMSLNSLFSNITPCENDRIIGQQTFATYYGNQWIGSLNEIDPTAMYKMKLCSQQIWCKQGLESNIQPISISSGYTWIGYLPKINLPVNTALSNIIPSPIYNDRINEQYSFSSYTGTKWVGSLSTLQKGKGYIIHMANSSFLTYPANSLKSPIQISNSQIQKSLPTANNVKTNARYNMQIVADILLPNGNISNNSYDTVYAYVGNECRGISSPLAGLNGKLFLTVGSDIDQGEIIHFKVFVSSLNQFFDVNSNLIFASEVETGTMGNPYQFDLTGSVGISLNNNQNGIKFGDIYPNPFDKTASLDFNIYNAGKVEGKIINGLGIEVQKIENKYFEAGSYILKIDGENLTPGIYSILIIYSNKENSSVITRKMIIK
jgi:hypothetical protein